MESILNFMKFYEKYIKFYAHKYIFQLQIY